MEWGTYLTSAVQISWRLLARKGISAFSRGLRLVAEAVEVAVDGHHPADGADAHLGSPLLHEGSVDTEGAELGVLLGAADEVHRGEVHLAHAPGSARLPIV